MRRHKELKWSEIARQSFEEKLRMLEWMNELLKNSEITDEDAIRMGRELNKRMAERIRKEREKRKSSS
ncbi:MAG: hypothetical protein ABIG96_03540 [Candidatus Micrarchaeota archaeon]